jgi:hypothetical protein
MLRKYETEVFPIRRDAIILEKNKGITLIIKHEVKIRRVNYR